MNAALAVQELRMVGDGHNCSMPDVWMEVEPAAPSAWKLPHAIGASTRIIVKFEGYTGRYVWHCHILEHEDNEMMRPYEVMAPARE